MTVTIALHLATWVLIATGLGLGIWQQRILPVCFSAMAFGVYLLDLWRVTPSWVPAMLLVLSYLALCGYLRKNRRFTPEAMVTARLACHEPAVSHWRALLLIALESAEERLEKSEIRRLERQQDATPEELMRREKAHLQQLIKDVEQAVYYGPERNPQAKQTVSSGAKLQHPGIAVDPYFPNSLIAMRNRLLDTPQADKHSDALDLALAPAKEVALAMPDSLQSALTVSGYHEALHQLLELEQK